MLSQIVMIYPAKRLKTVLALAFTEHGVTMLARFLKGKKVKQTSISIIRAFVFKRQYALTHKDLTEKLRELETKYDKQFKDVYEAINFLFQKDKQQSHKRIRFKKPFKQ